MAPVVPNKIGRKCVYVSAAVVRVFRISFVPAFMWNMVSEQAFTAESNTVTPDQRERAQVDTALCLTGSSLHCVASVNGMARRWGKKKTNS